MDAVDLLAAIRNGRTLYVRTPLRVTKIDARVVAKFDAVNRPVIKTGADGHLYLAQGRAYVDCHYADVRLI